MPQVTRVALNTSNETAGFYAKLGFRVVQRTPDGYRAGLDRYDLELTVDNGLRGRLAALGSANA